MVFSVLFFKRSFLMERVYLWHCLVSRKAFERMISIYIIEFVHKSNLVHGMVAPVGVSCLCCLNYLYRIKQIVVDGRLSRTYFFTIVLFFQYLVRMLSLSDIELLATLVSNLIFGKKPVWTLKLLYFFDLTN